MTPPGTAAIVKIESRLDVAKASKLVDDECWLYTGARTSNPRGNGGYGLVKCPGDPVPKYAHRLMYEKHVGPIPAGFHIDHLCEVTHCVNPEHLEAVSASENVRRHYERRSARAA